MSKTDDGLVNLQSFGPLPKSRIFPNWIKSVRESRSKKALKLLVHPLDQFGTASSAKMETDHGVEVIVTGGLS